MLVTQGTLESSPCSQTKLILVANDIHIYFSATDSFLMHLVHIFLESNNMILFQVWPGKIVKEFEHNKCREWL